jgi:mono/diheme cytochrome c family protein
VRRLALLAAAGAAIGFAAILSSCDRMANQPKLRGFTVPSGSDVAYPLSPPPGTVATDDKPTQPPPVTLALLQRGRERFNINCAPCHGLDGAGNGMIVQRGFPHPPSYHTDKLREAPIQHFYDVITNGYGVMFSYAARVKPPDRWAITAYIRALQASTVASLTDVPPEIRQNLQ